MRKAADVIPPAQLWVNPDCGLKTRAWPETRAALANMVEAARLLRGAPDWLHSCFISVRNVVFETHLLVETVNIV